MCLFSCFLGAPLSWALSTSIFLFIAFSYFRILRASVKQGNAGINIYKAFKTCASHFVVYLVYEISLLAIVASHSFTSLHTNIKKFLNLLFMVLPPIINPIVYGLSSKELRVSIIKHFSIQVCHK